jgi:hypothetical protein
MNISLQIQELDDLIIEHTTPPVTSKLRSKLHFIRDQLDAEFKTRFDKEQELSKLNASLVAQNTELVQAINTYEAKESALSAFEEHFGVLWKRSGKGFDPAPYCKECETHPIMMGLPPSVRPPSCWHCSKCGHNAAYCGFPKS